MLTFVLRHQNSRFSRSDCPTIKVRAFLGFFFFCMMNYYGENRRLSIVTLAKKKLAISTICSTVYHHNWIQTINSHFDCFRIFNTGELPSFSVVFWFHFLICRTFNNRQEQIIINGNILKPKWKKNILYLETRLLEDFYLHENTEGT